MGLLVGTRRRGVGRAPLVLSLGLGRGRSAARLRRFSLHCPGWGREPGWGGLYQYLQIVSSGSWGGEESLGVNGNGGV